MFGKGRKGKDLISPDRSTYPEADGSPGDLEGGPLVADSSAEGQGGDERKQRYEHWMEEEAKRFGGGGKRAEEEEQEEGQEPEE